MKLNLVVCDVCKDPTRSVKAWRLSREGESRVKELCEEHEAVLVKLWDGVGEATDLPSTATPRKRARRGIRVTTPEEIEASKAGKTG